MTASQAVKVEKLDLVSKDPAEVRQNVFPRDDLGRPYARTCRLKQVFDTPSHDRRTATYSHINVNRQSGYAGTFKISDKAVKVN